jgi:hypothetical protein
MKALGHVARSGQETWPDLQLYPYFSVTMAGQQGRGFYGYHPSMGGRCQDVYRPISSFIFEVDTSNHL